MVCPSCRESQPASFRCSNCGAQLMGARYGQRAEPATPVWKTPGPEAAGVLTQNPYRAPDSRVSRLRLPHTAAGPELASRGARLAAALIDAVAVFVPTIPLGAAAILAQSGRELEGGAIVTACLAALLLVSGIQIALLLRQGQTLGKKLLGIRIVDYRSNEVPSWLQLLGLRYLLNALLGALYIYALVDVLFIFGDERRCLHDYIAGTKVVEA